MKSIIRQAARSLSQSRLIRALKESQSRNAALIATIPDNIYLITPDGTYLEVFINDGSPLDPGRMIGKDIRKFSPTEVWQKGLEYVELAMQTGKVQIYDYSLVLPHDQQRHFFESRVAVIRERNEVVLIVRDITERRRFLQALSRRNQLLETLNELSQVALAHLEEGPILNNLARLAGQAIEATSAYICKWEAETYSYIVLSDYISAEANEQERKSDTGVSYTLAPDLQVKGEAWPLSPSGYALIERNDPSISPFHRQHLEEYNGQRILTVLLRVEGQPIGFIEVWDSRPERRISQTDIDTLMTIARQVSLSISSTRLYQALRESESKKSAIINAWPDLMFHMNREGVYLDAKVPSHSPLTREQLIGHQAAEFLDQEVAAMTMYQIEKALETGQVQFYEYQIAEYYGVRDYESRMVKCAEDEALALVRDITDRKRYEKELAQARDAALESSRTKSQFLANMSHELRTPLNSIINYTQLLLDGIYGDISSTQRDRMEKVLRNGRNLLSLVNDVLDLSKIEAGQMRLNRRLVEVDEFIASLMALFKPLAQEKNLNLDYLPPAVPPPALYVDEIRARQVLTNVIGNAIKFTHEGGVTLRCFMEAEGLCMSVTDTGIGIPAEAQSHIFDEFRQVDNSSTRQYEGTGLGLTISRRIVEMHGGSIRLESTLGSGTTFYITFPLADKEALEKDKAGEEAVQA
jgi:signal transduction histidine kinase